MTLKIKICLMWVAAGKQASDDEDVRQHFAALDRNKDGKITMDEAFSNMEENVKRQLEEKDMRFVEGGFMAADADSDGVINLEGKKART